MSRYSRYIDAEELKHILNSSKYYGTKAGRDFADMITECNAAETKTVRYWHEDLQRASRPHKVIEVE